MVCRRPMRFVVAVSLLLGCASSSVAAPVDELLRLVPGDVGFCVVVRDLRNHTAALESSPFAKQLRNSALARLFITGPEMQQLALTEEQVKKYLGVGWKELRDDVLGDAVVFAYRPGPTREVALLFLQVRDEKLLRRVVERLNEAQREAGDLRELEVRDYRGQKYYHRVERKEDSFYCVLGMRLLLATKEDALQQALDRLAEGAKADAPVARELRQLGVAEQLAIVWINPRAFDAEIAANTAHVSGAGAVVLATFNRYWRAAESVAISFDLQREARLEIAVRARTDDLPDSAKRFFSEIAQPSLLWARFPERALLAVAVRVDGSALLEMLGEFLTPEDRPAARAKLERDLAPILGKDLFREVLPHVGPDVGVCITAPPAADPAWFPRALLAVSVGAGDNPAAPVDQALFATVDFYVKSAVVAYNKQHDLQLALKSPMAEKERIKFLVNDQLLPPGLQPAFGLQQGYLLVASNADVIRRFAEEASPSPASSSQEVPLVRVSLKGWRQYLVDHREPMTTWITSKSGLSKEETGTRLDNLLSTLEWFDRVEISQRPQRGQLNLIVRIHLVESLR